MNIKVTIELCLLISFAFGRLQCNNRIRLLFDGGSRGSQGFHGASGGIFICNSPKQSAEEPTHKYSSDVLGHKLYQASFWFGKHISSHEAEYLALLEGLYSLSRIMDTQDLRYSTDIIINGDSEIIIKDLNKSNAHKKSKNIFHLHEYCKALIASFPNVRLEHISRANNHITDNLATIDSIPIDINFNYIENNNILIKFEIFDRINKEIHTTTEFNLNLPSADKNSNSNDKYLQWQQIHLPLPSKLKSILLKSVITTTTTTTTTDEPSMSLSSLSSTISSSSTPSSSPSSPSSSSSFDSFTTATSPLYYIPSSSFQYCSTSYVRRIFAEENLFIVEQLILALARRGLLTPSFFFTNISNNSNNTSSNLLESLFISMARFQNIRLLFRLVGRSLLASYQEMMSLHIVSDPLQSDMSSYYSCYNCSNNNGNNVLHLAVLCKSLPSLRLLLKELTSISTSKSITSTSMSAIGIKSRNHRKFIHRPIQLQLQSDVSDSKESVTDMMLSQTNNDGYTPVSLATKLSRMDMVRAMLSKHVLNNVIEEDKVEDELLS
eukprot:gene8342-17180_t